MRGFEYTPLASPLTPRRATRDRDDLPTRGDVSCCQSSPRLIGPAFGYNISPNGACGDLYWEVACGGNVVARGLTATQAQARMP
jgi:hypothetical protein